jgi:glycosyltransferase involved in cell wall biosynthesis
VKVVVPVRHCYGHHLVFPRPFIERLERDTRFGPVEFVLDERCAPVADAMPWFGSRNVRFVTFDLGGRAFAELLEAEVGKGGVLFLPTLEEWVPDLARAHRRLAMADTPLVFGVCHYLRRRIVPATFRNAIRAAWQPLSLRLLRRSLRTPGLLPVAMSRRLVERWLPQDHEAFRFVPHPLQGFAPVAPITEVSDRLLVFGSIRPDKRVEEIVDAVVQARAAGVAVRVQVVGRFEPAYGRRLRKLLDRPEVAAAVEFEDRFVSDAERIRMMRGALAVVLNYRGGDYRDGMQSGVLFDALALGAGVLAHADLEVPDEARTVRRFGVQPGDFTTAVRALLGSRSERDERVRSVRAALLDRFESETAALLDELAAARVA